MKERDHVIREAEHHVRKAKHHRATAKAAGKFLEMHKTAKSDMEGLDELIESYIEQHSAIADEHTDYAEHCAKYAKSLSDGTGARKVAGMENGDELEPFPEGFSRVVPDVPQNFRAVPRFGQREIAQAVAPEFRKLVSIEDEE